MPSTSKPALKILDAYLSDAAVSELMWNGHQSAFAERNGKMYQIASPFQSEAEFEALIETLADLPNTINGETLHFDGVLPEGSRFHVTRPPLSPSGSTLTIRKFSPVHRGLDKLVSAGFMSDKARIFLEATLRGRMNIVISGNTGAGKTTLLNALASRIDESERIISIEDIPEIQLNHQNWVRLIAVQNKSKVSVRDCLVGCLRMRPDRIVVGECRSSETIEMLQAMNTGHDGGMTTVHANSCVEALTRLESLVMFHSEIELGLKALRKQIVDAVDLIIQVGKDPAGNRGIQEIMEVVAMEGDVITRSSLFKRANGKLTGTGHVPAFISRLEERGAILPKGFFEPTAFEK